MSKKNKRNIDHVIDNKDKQKTYTELNKRRNDDIKNGKYIAAITFDYAMIEDRLLSILKYLNLIEYNQIENKYIINALNRLNIYEFYYKNQDEEHKDPKIYNISTKYKIIEKLIKYNGNNNEIVQIKNNLLSTCDFLLLKKYIKNLDNWCKKRNEVIHAMYNKNILDLDKKTENIALEGKELSYIFSKICNDIKRIN